MQIVDGKICYEIDELPKSQLYKDLGYQIIATSEPKQVLSIMKYLLKDEVKFILDHDIFDERLKGENIEYYITDGTTKLVDAVTLKMFKYLREKVTKFPELGDINNFYEKLFSHKGEDKLSLYIDIDDERDGSRYAQDFMWYIVSPALNYVLDKYCDKEYEIIVRETTEKRYVVASPLDGMSDEDVIKALKKVDHKDSTRKEIERIFVGYKKRDGSSEEPSEK